MCENRKNNIPSIMDSDHCNSTYVCDQCLFVFCENCVGMSSDKQYIICYHCFIEIIFTILSLVSTTRDIDFRHTTECEM